MPENNPQFRGSNNRNIIIWIIVFAVIAFIIGQQVLAMQNTGKNGEPRVTDQLITSEFLQAVEQDRVTSVVYDARNYTVTGEYYPAATSGQSAVEAFNEAFSAMNAKVAQVQKTLGGEVTGVGMGTLEAQTLGELHSYH